MIPANPPVGVGLHAVGTLSAPSCYIYDKLFREWESAGPLPKRVVHYGKILVVVATLIITYGNHIGQQN